MADEKPQSSGRNATLVAAGILLSRVMGLVRQRLYAHWLGTSSPAAAALAAALRIPNFPQNLLGEGVLSASFIPVYARLRAQGRHQEAEEVAGGVFGLLAFVLGLITAAGVLGAPLLVDLLAPGFTGDTRAMTVTYTRVLFPGTGLLVMSAWCLGILNSHRKFFLSYAAPVAWNLCIIAALLAFGGRVEANELALYSAVATSVGAVAQLVVQWPGVRAVLAHLRPSVRPSHPGVREVLKGFGPAVLSRGVVQLSAWLDGAYASLITERAVAVIASTQTIALLPVSLFGMAVSAAELPEMSADAAHGGGEERKAALIARLEQGLNRIAFFVVPSAFAFLTLGDGLSGLLLESGRFSARDSRLVWYLLIAASVGLLAQTSGRLYASAFWALKDTRTPLRAALVRVGVNAVLGYTAARLAAPALGLPADLGAAMLTLASALCAMLETLTLRVRLARELGRDVHASRALMGKVVVASLLAGAAALTLKVLAVQRFGAAPRCLEEWGGELLPSPDLRPYLFAPAQIALYGAVYLGLAVGLGVPQAKGFAQRLKRLIRRG
ncbi:MAG: murein biosynthesis integral membrane protein MurJ [Myxococcaceae bacterium]|nr:murein biosynthesis integral membrane protein MurJ [Myxococcaceae bacterium]